jgi:type IV secretion system protein VirB1
MSDLTALLLACAPLVAPDTAHALVEVESAGNPFAIGVVGGTLVRQPSNAADAIATVRSLEAAGWDYSLGLAQVNKHNLARLGLTPETAFEPCRNLAAMQTILGECYTRAALATHAGDRSAVLRSLSCYYSGNFQTGFDQGYVQHVVVTWSELQRPSMRKEVK